MAWRGGVAVGKNLVISDGPRDLPLAPGRGPPDRGQPPAKRSAPPRHGIGPCYPDKVGRSYAIRLGDLYRDGIREKIERVCTRTRSSSYCRARLGPRRSIPRKSTPNIVNTPSDCALTWPTPRHCCSMRSSAAPRAFEGAQARSWTSITAPFPMSPAAIARGSAFPAAPACPAATWKRSSGS